VEGSGLPLAARLSAGNENERRHVIPLLDSLAARGIHPGQLWADRGYDSRELERQLEEGASSPASVAAVCPASPSRKAPRRARSGAGGNVG